MAVSASKFPLAEFDEAVDELPLVPPLFEVLLDGGVAAVPVSELSPCELLLDAPPDDNEEAPFLVLRLPEGSIGGGVAAVRVSELAPCELLLDAPPDDNEEAPFLVLRLPEGSIGGGVAAVRVSELAPCELLLDAPPDDADVAPPSASPPVVPPLVL